MHHADVKSKLNILIETDPNLDGKLDIITANYHAVSQPLLSPPQAFPLCCSNSIEG